MNAVARAQLTFQMLTLLKNIFIRICICICVCICICTCICTCSCTCTCTSTCTCTCICLYVYLWHLCTGGWVLKCLNWVGSNEPGSFTWIAIRQSKNPCSQLENSHWQINYTLTTEFVMWAKKANFNSSYLTIVYGSSVATVKFLILAI